MPSNQQELTLKDLETKVTEALERRQQLTQDLAYTADHLRLKRAENSQLLDMLSEAYPDIASDLSTSSEEEEVVVQKPPKRQRRKPVARDEPRSVDPLPLDAEGQIKLPVVVGRGQEEVHIHSLGQVVWDREGFHTNRYIWPVGFRSSRQMTSVRDMNRRCWYASEILEEPGSADPVFQVTPEDGSEPFRAGSSSGAWKQVMEQLAATGNVTKTQVSGPQMYGLNHLGVVKAIQELEGAEKCQKYVRQKWK